MMWRHHADKLLSCCCGCFSALSVLLGGKVSAAELLTADPAAFAFLADAALAERVAIEGTSRLLFMRYCA